MILSLVKAGVGRKFYSPLRHFWCCLILRGLNNSAIVAILLDKERADGRGDGGPEMEIMVEIFHVFSAIKLAKCIYELIYRVIF